MEDGSTREKHQGCCLIWRLKKKEFCLLYAATGSRGQSPDVLVHPIRDGRQAALQPQWMGLLSWSRSLKWSINDSINIAVLQLHSNALILDYLRHGCMKGQIERLWSSKFCKHCRSMRGFHTGNWHIRRSESNLWKEARFAIMTDNYKSRRWSNMVNVKLPLQDSFHFWSNLTYWKTFSLPIYESKSINCCYSFTAKLCMERTVLVIVCLGIMVSFEVLTPML